MDFIVGIFVLKELEYSLGEIIFGQHLAKCLAETFCLVWIMLVKKKIKLKCVFHFALHFARLPTTYIHLHTIYFT